MADLSMESNSKSSLGSWCGQVVWAPISILAGFIYLDLSPSFESSNQKVTANSAVDPSKAGK